MPRYTNAQDALLSHQPMDTYYSEMFSKYLRKKPVLISFVRCHRFSLWSLSHLTAFLMGIPCVL